MSVKRILVWETLAEIYGGQKVTLDVTEMLLKKYDVSFVIPKKGPLSRELDELGINYRLLGYLEMPLGEKRIIDIFRYFIYAAAVFLKVANIIIKDKIDLIYVPGPSALPLGAMVGSITRKPVIWHIHHIFEDKKAVKLLNVTSNFKSVKKIITVSNYVGSQICSKYGKLKLSVIYNGVDFTNYSSGKKDVFRKEFGIPKDSFLIASVGILQEQKRHDVLIKAVKILRGKGFNVCGAIVGSERNDENIFKRKLQNLADKNGVSKFIFFTGFRKDIPDIIRDVNAVLISDAEGFPLVALEFMCGGIPVVSTNLGGTPELITASSGGVIYDDKNRVSDAIEQLFDDSFYNKCSKSGIAFVKSNDDTEFRNKIIKIFLEILH